MIYVLIAGYLAGFMVFCRCFVWYAANRWSNLGWSGDDAAFCIALGLLWPISFIVCGFNFISELMRQRGPTITIPWLPFSELFERMRPHNCKKSRGRDS